jgi:6,7-dimethyl-8-ribityllumazine synthase
MSGSGAPRVDVGEVSGLRVVVIASSWHDGVMSGLVAGALRACADAGVEPELVRVPGAFELPVTAQAAARSGAQAVVCLGVVIRGGTPHFDYVCSAVTDGLTRVALDEGVPVGFGVLTCDDEAQALDRAGLPDSREDKGREAVEAALSTALRLEQLRALG